MCEGFKWSKKGAVKPKESLSFLFTGHLHSSTAQTAESEGSPWSGTPSALLSLHTTAPLDPRLPGYAITGPECAQTGWDQKQPGNIIRKSQSTPRIPVSLRTEENQQPSVLIWNPQGWAKETLPRKSCKLKRVTASRRVGDWRVHFGVVKNLQWSIQVKGSGIYPEERGYKQVSYEKLHEGNLYLIRCQRTIEKNLRLL